MPKEVRPLGPISGPRYAIKFPFHVELGDEPGTVLVAVGDSGIPLPRVELHSVQGLSPRAVGAIQDAAEDAAIAEFIRQSITVER